MEKWTDQNAADNAEKFGKEYLQEDWSELVKKVQEEYDFVNNRLDAVDTYYEKLRGKIIELGSKSVNEKTAEDVALLEQVDEEYEQVKEAALKLESRFKYLDEILEHFKSEKVAPVTTSKSVNRPESLN